MTLAIFLYSLGSMIRRGAGQSAVKVAAYQARENLTDHRTGYRYNHQPKPRGIVAASAYIDREAGYDEGRKPALFVGLYAPSDAPAWCRGRENIEELWSRAELAERRHDAQIAERIIIALPSELTLPQNIWLLQDHIKEFTRQGRVVQVAIHAPEHGDDRNIHAHLLVSMRGVDAQGFKASKAEAQDRYRQRSQYVTDLRERWAKAANHHLGRHGHKARIDHRTLAAQGIDREPTMHLGPGDSRRERQGERSVAGEINREIAARNARRAELVDQTPAIDRAVAQKAAGSARTATAPRGRPTLTPASGGAQSRQKSLPKEGGYWRTLRDRNRTAVPRLSPELTLADVARELSPAYEEQLEAIKRLKGEIAKAEKAADHRQRDIIGYNHERDLRWEQLGWIRKGLHKVGLRDREIAGHEAAAQRASKGLDRMRVKRWALRGALETAERQAARELDKIRPEAEAVLAERQQTAAAARATLAELPMQTGHQDEVLRPQRQRRGFRFGV